MQAQEEREKREQQQSQKGDGGGGSYADEAKEWEVHKGYSGHEKGSYSGSRGARPIPIHPKVGQHQHTRQDRDVGGEGPECQWEMMETDDSQQQGGSVAALANHSAGHEGTAHPDAALGTAFNSQGRSNAGDRVVGRVRVHGDRDGETDITTETLTEEPVPYLTDCQEVNEPLRLPRIRQTIALLGPQPANDSALGQAVQENHVANDDSASNTLIAHAQADGRRAGSSSSDRYASGVESTKADCHTQAAELEAAADAGAHAARELDDLGDMLLFDSNDEGDNIAESQGSVDPQPSIEDLQEMWKQTFGEQCNEPANEPADEQAGVQQERSDGSGDVCAGDRQIIDSPMRPVQRENHDISGVLEDDEDVEDIEDDEDVEDVEDVEDEDEDDEDEDDEDDEDEDDEDDADVLTASNENAVNTDSGRSGDEVGGSAGDSGGGSAAGDAAFTDGFSNGVGKNVTGVEGSGADVDARASTYGAVSATTAPAENQEQPQLVQHLEQQQLIQQHLQKKNSRNGRRRSVLARIRRRTSSTPQEDV
jgi:hypothetical protein